MRNRPDMLATLASIALFLVACAPPGNGEKAAADDDTAKTPGAQVSFEGWAPVTASCAAVESYLADRGAADYAAPADGDSVTIALTLDGDDLAAEPPRAVVRQGQSVQWVSDTLETWGVRFLEMAPAPKAPNVIRGTEKGKPAPAAAAEVTGDCGRYYYVASAIHPETGQMLILDPPLMVRN